MKAFGKICLLFLFLFLVRSLSAQTGIKGLINAEKAFASFTASNSIPAGFLKFMDSTGLIFSQGKALNAHQVYRMQKPGPAILNWAPDFAVVSAAGDMGVTTGPYELRPSSQNDKPVAKGYFTSIWQLNADHEWKNLADLGTHCEAAALPVTEVKEISLPGQTVPDYSMSMILSMDNLLNKAIEDKNKSDWIPLLTSNSRLTLDNEISLTGEKAWTTALLASPSRLLLNATGGGLSSGKDFAYTYGTVINGERRENYLRAWVYQKKQWKLILQTLKW